MHTQLVYRTFSELMDSVRTDLKTLSLEGMIDEGDLVKVAQKINYELGLKINPSRQVILEVENYKAKLPNDVYVLNFAAELGSRKPPTSSFHPASYYLIQLQEALKNYPFTHPDPGIQSYDTTQDIPVGYSFIRHKLNTEAIILQITSPDGELVITDFETINPHEIRIFAQIPLADAKVVVLGKSDPSPLANPPISRDPIDAPVIRVHKSAKSIDLNDFESFKILVIRPDRSVAQNSECIRHSGLQNYEAYIKNGFLVTDFQSGLILLNYQGALEDDDGNLLVLDHPQVNDYYEYAFKQRIYENLILNGEPQQNNLQLIEARFRPARNNAISWANMPSFRDMKDLWERNRRIHYQKYYSIIA